MKQINIKITMLSIILSFMTVKHLDASYRVVRENEPISDQFELGNSYQYGSGGVAHGRIKKIDLGKQTLGEQTFLVREYNKITSKGSFEKQCCYNMGYVASALLLGCFVFSALLNTEAPTKRLRIAEPNLISPSDPLPTYFFNRTLTLEYDLLEGASGFGKFSARNVPQAQAANYEKQTYTEKNAHYDPQSHILTITANRGEDGKIYSARLDTKGNWATNSIGLHGYIEVKSFLPTSYKNSNELDPRLAGGWPAIWMMPTRDVLWPGGGEIDIMEMVNGNPKWYAALHSSNNYGGHCQYPGNMHPRYKPFDLGYDLTKTPGIFGLEWQVRKEDEKIDLTWWATYSENGAMKITTLSIRLGDRVGDDREVFSKSFEEGGFYLIVNFAQGGNFPDGSRGNRDPELLQAVYPQNMTILSAKAYSFS